MAEPTKSSELPPDGSDADLRKAVLQTFLIEAEERLAEMEEALVALENQPDDEDLVQTLFRGAHTLKGNSSTLDFPKLSEFANAMKVVLQRFRGLSHPVSVGGRRPNQPP